MPFGGNHISVTSIKRTVEVKFADYFDYSLLSLFDQQLYQRHPHNVFFTNDTHFESLEKWCKEHCYGRFVFLTKVPIILYPKTMTTSIGSDGVKYFVRFELNTDAVLFKLKID